MIHTLKHSGMINDQNLSHPTSVHICLVILSLILVLTIKVVQYFGSYAESQLELVIGALGQNLY